MPFPAPQTSSHQAVTLAPFEKAEQKPLLRMNSIENKTSFMKSVVHDCQVDHDHWNNNIMHLVRRLVVN